MIRIKYEEYYNDFMRKQKEKEFIGLAESDIGLKALEEWIFGQMRQNYSDKEKGQYAMSFPTPERVSRIKADGPWEIEFVPERGGPHIWIHMIEICGHGIIFSDGKMTAGQRYWNQSAQDWLVHCNERQYHPTFNFV